MKGGWIYQEMVKGIRHTPDPGLPTAQDRYVVLTRTQGSKLMGKNNQF